MTWQPVAAFAVGTAVGVALPRILLAACDLCARSRLQTRASAFVSLLAANGASLAGGALVGWIAGGAVFAGLLIVAVAYRNHRTEPERTIQSYARSFGMYFMMIVMLGAGLVAQ